MSTLMERALKLISSKPVLLGALAIVPLSTTARTAEALVPAPYPVSTEQVFFHNSTTGDTTYPGSLGHTGINPLSLFSNGTISINGTTYIADASPNPVGSHLALRWSGPVNPSFFPVNNSAVSVHYDFIIGHQVSGGSVSWTLLDDLGGITLNASGTETVINGTQEFSGTLTSPVISPIGSSWSSELDLVWNTPDPAGTMTVNVPGGASIDLSVTGVPEPAGLSVLGIGVSGLLLRRRRRE